MGIIERIEYTYSPQRLYKNSQNDSKNSCFKKNIIVVVTNIV